MMMTKDDKSKKAGRVTNVKLDVKGKKSRIWAVSLVYKAQIRCTGKLTGWPTKSCGCARPRQCDGEGAAVM